MQQRLVINTVKSVMLQDSSYAHINAALMISVWAAARSASAPSPAHSPFDQLDGDEVVPVSAVEDDEPVGRRGFELKEEVHCGVGLQRGQAQVAALGLEGHGVGDDEAHAKAGVQLAEVDVAVLAHVDVLHAVELEALRRELAQDVSLTANYEAHVDFI